MVMNFMIKRLAIAALLRALLCTVAYANASSHGITVSCMMAYEEGGAHAVFNSPECSQLVFSAESWNSTKNCQFAMLQGRREYQEDRVACNLDLKLPFSGGGPEETTIGVAAIFDGHGGDEASEMASEMLLDYFIVHVEFTAYKQVLPNYQENNKSHASHHSTPVVIDRHSLRSILEEALLRTIQDIDSEFSKVALDKGYVSGSTGTIVLLYNGHLFAANVGDSKALLCSKKGDSSKEEVYVDELTRDHHPDREDEKARIKAAGGFITRDDVPRVNGVLSMSRAIGDIYLKRYGVTAEPEITGWRAFTSENSYLVVASDGIFETLTPKNVCDLLHDKASELSSKHVPPSSLPERIIRRAFKTGRRDNLSAIVISDLRHACNFI